MTALIEQEEARQRTVLDELAKSLGKGVKRIETHASVVFLTESQAIKVKRAVKFPFLDYSTLDRRRRACEEECAINRRFAPELYLGAVPIRRQGAGACAIEGKGEVVDWAVLMLRFDENCAFDRLADRKALTEPLVTKLADKVLRSHKSAPVAGTGPWLEAFESYIAQNERDFTQQPEIFPPDMVRRLTRESKNAFSRIRDLLIARGRAGFIRRMHGDLHLGNVVLIGNDPVLFDAIEFDPLVATGDVLYDLGFLLMDLAERDLLDAANTVLNRYLQRSGTESHLHALATLPLFISMRAAIRAKVTTARAKTMDGSSRASVERTARRYFDFALVALDRAEPRLVAIGGLSGTGKSVLAKQLAKHLMPIPGAVILRSDIERKRMFGVSEHSSLPQAAYSREAGHRVYRVLASKAQIILSAGHSVIVDAVFADASERREISACLPGVDFRGLFLVADPQTRCARVATRKDDVSDADRDVVLRQEEYQLGEITWARIDANGDAATTYRNAVDTVSANGARAVDQDQSGTLPRP